MVASVPELTMRTISMPGTASTTAWASSTSRRQGAPKLVYENGLPRFAHLRKVRAK